MTLYELTEAMRFFDLEIDEETGEILNGDELDLLQMDFDQKLKNCVYWYKNQKAEADALVHRRVPGRGQEVRPGG